MKIAIVGSGIAGIATSIHLALLKNTEVHVFEANNYLGGKLTAFQQGDFRFDAGPSLFTMPYLMDDLFKKAGKKPQDYFNYNQLEIACNYFWEDGVKLSAYTNSNAFSEEVNEKLGVSKTVISNYLSHSAFLFETTASLFLEKSLHRLSTYLSKDVAKALVNVWKLGLTKTMHQSNVQKLKEPHLVQLFNRFATYNGSNPYQAPGVLNIIPHLEHNQGAFMPVGGMHQITQSLVKLAKELGVQFHLNQRVEEILAKNQRIQGIKMKNAHFDADVVVSNMDVVPTYRKLLPKQKAPEVTLSQERSSSALIFYWGISREFQELDVHNILFAEDYKAEFTHLFDKKLMYEDPTVYIHISSKKVHEDAPENAENWFVMINVPGDSSINWQQEIEKARKRIIKKINRTLKIEIEPFIVNESVLDPQQIESKTSSFQGALYGSSSNNRMSAFLRHPNFSQTIKGLYFCGGSVHPGGGIPLCLLSGKIASELIEKDFFHA